MQSENQNKTSNTAIALIWFSAAISMAEILTGTWFASLGWQQGLTAILLGHLIGGGLFFCAGYIGAKTRKSAMQSVQISFGEKGSILFSLLNALQLMGWTAVMIYMGADVISILNQDAQATWFPYLALLLGGLVILWLWLGFQRVNLIQSISLITMFLLMLWLSVKVFGGDFSAASNIDTSIKFGTAVEIAAVMPLSWLPVVSDHTRNARSPLKTTAIATASYTVTSCWMYCLGLGAALLTGQNEISKILALTGINIFGILIVVVATMINDALPAYSTGMSINNIFPKLRTTPIAIITVIIGIVLAISLPVTQYEDFLFFIGSVFAPMISVLIADFFVLKQTEVRKSVDFVGLALWLVGFVAYRVLMHYEWESDLGLTLPVMIGTCLLTIIVRKALK